MGYWTIGEHILASPCVLTAEMKLYLKNQRFSSDSKLVAYTKRTHYDKITEYMKPAIERFNAKYVISTDMFYDGSPCWIWTAAKNSGGYGLFHVSSVSPCRLAHRWSYEYHVGPILGGLSLDHMCRIRNCVNPAHLEAVPVVVNVLRGNSWSGRNLRKTHCINGHELTAENIYSGVNGKRRLCLTCRSKRSREYYARKKSKETNA